MKRVIPILLLVMMVVISIDVALIGNIVFAQDDTLPGGDPTIPAEPVFPYILLIPYFIGTFVHWIKKYMENPNMTFINWFLKNIIWSISTIVAGIGSIWAMWLVSGHSGLYPVTIGSWIAVWWIGVGADSFNRAVNGNGGTNKAINSATQ